MLENRRDRCYLFPAVANEQTGGLRGVNLQTGKKEKEVSEQKKGGKWGKLGLEGISKASRKRFGGIWGKVVSQFRKVKMTGSCSRGDLERMNKLVSKYKKRKLIQTDKR